MKKYLVRNSPTETKEVEAVSEEYRGHFLFVNWEGNLAAAHIETGLIIKRSVTIEDWKQLVDRVITLTERNAINVSGPFVALGSMGIMPEPYAPEGFVQDVLKAFKLP